MPMIPKKPRGQSGEVNINMTPMIDMVFQLIIFFILTTTFVKAELARMDIPKPHEPWTPKKEKRDEPNVIMLQAVSKADLPKDPDGWGDASQAAELSHYQLGAREFSVQQVRTDMVEAIKERRDQAAELGYEEFKVQIRADRRLQTMYVQPLMEAAYRAGITDMEVVTEQR
jgi:biopolymer transport protein ExbD